MVQVVIACPCIVVVMWRRIFVYIMPREMPLIVVVGGFVLIMMNTVMDGRPFVELHQVQGK
jgi:hypothetical protein